MSDQTSLDEILAIESQFSEEERAARDAVHGWVKDRFLPIVTQVFLWGAIYGVARGGSHGEERLNGYAYRDMVAYYLLAMLGRAFSSMPGLSTGIANDVRDGSIKKYLTQPVDMLSYLFCARVAHKLVYYLVAAAPFAFVFWCFRGFFEHRPDALTWLAFVVALVVAAPLSGAAIGAVAGGAGMAVAPARQPVDKVADAGQAFGRIQRLAPHPDRLAHPGEIEQLDCHRLNPYASGRRADNPSR